MKGCEEISITHYFVFSFVIIFLFLALGIFFFLTLFLFEEDLRGNGSKVERSNVYQLQEIRSTSNKPSFGSAKMSRVLSEDDFISYSNPTTGSFVVISKFSDTTFECHGSCFCESPNSIRRGSGILSQGMSLFISAFSVSVALVVAKHAFEDQCIKKMSDSCEEGVSSQVSSCSKKAEENEGMDELGEFSCSGHCFDRKFISSSGNDAMEKFRKETGGCQTLSTKGNVKIAKEKLPYGFTFRKRTAQIRFAQEYLRSFCKEVSKREYIWVAKRNYQRFYESKMMGKRTYEMKGEIERDGYMCRGLEKRGNSYSYKHIKCHMVY